MSNRVAEENMSVTEKRSRASAKKVGEPATKGSTRTPTKSTKPIHLTRLRNLQEIIDKRFDGNATHAAKAIERSHTFIWQLMNGYRSIGEDTARLIENKLMLDQNWMDRAKGCKRSESLIAQLADGHTLEYRMVPLKDLDHMSAKSTTWYPFPVHGASKQAYCVTVNSDTIGGIHIGDLIYVDQLASGEAPVNEKLYLVKVPGVWADDTAGILMARQHTGKRWTFETRPSCRYDVERRKKLLEIYTDKQVEVIARVVSVVRHL